MKPEIASLKDRIAQGGNWRAFRDELATLHAEAKTEDEYVTLLEAWHGLVAAAKYAYDDETYGKLIPVMRAEYLTFLNRESIEHDVINPIRLEYVTRREVEAGRMDPNDEFRKIAVAGATVLGDSTQLTVHRCRKGDWFFYGMTSAAILALGFNQIHQSPLWLIATGFLAGWAINEVERKQIKARPTELPE